jgi:CheY-like chemotaxis protein
MKKKKILIVDDEKNFTELLKFNLEDLGAFEVETENEGRRALGKALDFRPDMIFLDVIMPDMEGPDVLYELESRKETQDIPVVFLTATITKEEVQQQKGVVGGRTFLAKPSDLQEVIHSIDDQLNISYHR